MPPKKNDADTSNAKGAAKGAGDQPAATAAATPVAGNPPSPATTTAELEERGIQVLAEVKRADGLISRVLQDAKRVWKELFHAA